MADLVPIRLSLSAGDRYTVWAPRWRDAGDEWEAFLGRDEDLFGFETVADLVAFVRTDSDNDLVDHPAWDDLTSAHAHTFEPAEDKQFDLIAVEELVAEKPTAESVNTLAAALAIVSSIGSVCELAAVSKFFNGNPDLGTVSAGIDHFAGKAGHKRWNSIATIIGRSWDDVLSAIEEIISTPEVDADASAKAADELAEEPEEPPEETEEDGGEDEEAADEPEDEAADEDSDEEGEEEGEDDEGEEDETEDADDEGDARAEGDTVVLGSEDDFWLQVGIDPIRIMTDSGTFYTLRCYLDDSPIFLGRNGRISVFSSERALARYLADEHDHDLSDLSTYDDIRTAATDGSLAVDITDDNIYVLSGLGDDFADGPDAVDKDQLELAVELLRDIGDYSEESTVDKALETGRPLGKLVASVLEPDSVSKPSAPYSAAVREWEQLERFVESRLRRE
ncbi:protein export chaperone SatS [Mycobacterium sp.]|uniref:protein export chaperone SatS n=1 Tax=Mycobacterium sp. TaxID=1785 RepID=UPI003F969D32